MTITITDKVGRFCTNRLPDVATIQDALNRVPVEQGGTPPGKKLPVNGNCGNQTIEAVQLFQLKQFGWSGADGKIFPGGETITRLNQILAATTPGLSLPPPEIEPTTSAFTIRMSTGGIDKTLISELDTLFLLIEDAANGVGAIYRVKHFFGRDEAAPPLQKFGLPEAMPWTDAPVSVNAFQNAGFHYVSRAASTKMFVLDPIPDVATQNTMVIHLHPDQGDSEKRWFMLRRNTILEAFEPAFRAAQEKKYGVWFERRIEGRIERVS